MPPVQQMRQSFLVMDADRAVHVGSFGKPAWRELGSYTVYVSLNRPFVLRLGDGTWAEHLVARVRPYVPHVVTSPDERVGVVMIEAESLNIDLLPCRQGLLYRQGPLTYGSMLPFLQGRLHSLIDELRQGATIHELFSEGLELALYGQPRERQALDPRIAHVVRLISEQPALHVAAADRAREVELSLSRFLHLFKLETGVTFRRFLGWKRARFVLAHVGTGVNLTEVALDAGYADSTHLSHSIRRVYGLRPRDLHSSSRDLEMLAL